MITFEPLNKLLKEKSMSIDEFSELTGILRNNIYQILRGDTIPQTAMVEKFCKALNCDIGDVICYTDEKVLFNAPLSIDYDNLKSVFKLHGYSFYSAALKLGKRPIFFSEKARNNSIIRKDDLIEYCKDLDIDPKEITDEI